jgi:hypothetical protein
MDQEGLEPARAQPTAQEAGLLGGAAEIETGDDTQNPDPVQRDCSGLGS